MKKKIIIVTTIVVLIVASLVTLICFSKPGEVTKNITVTVSSQLVKTDVSELSPYHTYEYYELKDEYEYYSCIVKVENNSEDDICNVEFRNMTAENFRIDYELDFFAPFYIPANSTGYVTTIISVKKEITQDELNHIAYELPEKITLSFGDTDDIEYDLIITKKYNIVDEDFSGYDVQTHSYI